MRRTSFFVGSLPIASLPVQDSSKKKKQRRLHRKWYKRGRKRSRTRTRTNETVTAAASDGVAASPSPSSLETTYRYCTSRRLSARRGGPSLGARVVAAAAAGVATSLSSSWRVSFSSHQPISALSTTTGSSSRRWATEEGAIGYRHDSTAAGGGESALFFCDAY